MAMFWDVEDWMRERDGVPYIELEPIVKSGIALSVVSTRIGGISSPPYHELNLGSHVGDDPEKVRGNRKRFALATDIDLESLRLPRQIHSAECIVLTKPDESIGECDGVITDLKGIALGVLTADCAPILLVAPSFGVVGVAHAGWRGTLAGIAKNALELMIGRFKVDPSDCLAVIGPSIGRCCYEVSEALASKFRSRFGPQVVSGRHVDLPLANALSLVRMGVPEGRIWICRSCTACREDIFFSHRRDGLTGRMLSLVVLI
ncbi:TPA: peptidoglycan editing factor PgeF [Candidatus Poribacteria bacterium]|nr:peptidoglycan editing factor PgeF [Candidatus Poribacteria bacterium]